MLKLKQANDYQNTTNLLRSFGAWAIHPVFITPPEDWLVEGGINFDDLMEDIMRSEARAGCECYLGTLEDGNMKTLSDIMAFNEANDDKEFDDGNTFFRSSVSIDADAYEFSGPTRMAC